MNINPQEALNPLKENLKKEFIENKRVLSFDEYLHILAQTEKPPLRSSTQYIVDMMDHFGKEEIKNHPSPLYLGQKIYRFKIFDEAIGGITPKLIGHENVQTEIYECLTSFSRQGSNNRMILLHGPNGSAKSTLVHGLMNGLEKYSETPEGALYRFHWVFPVDRITKGRLGLQKFSEPEKHTLSFAKLPDEEIASKIQCELKDHPLLLIPEKQRKNTILKIFGETNGNSIWNKLPHYLTKGQLCHRCKEIYEALLNSYEGDYEKLLMHIQVERFYLSQRYRKGLVTIEPQMHVDAHYGQLTMNKSLSNLPSTLQSLNLFTLGGDLIDGNRGLIEYSDLLKRPIDTFKYLLGVCENGSVNVGNSIVYLDTLLMGSTNELQLDAFKEFPDFNSFKARLYLIRVPYLLSFTKEKELYSLLLPRLKGDKALSPHTDWALSLWAVLTRLKKPNSIHYTPALSGIISRLTPLEKAKIYDSGELPERLSPEERKLIRSHLKRLKEEYDNIPYYEGRTGASAREIHSIIFDAVQNQDFPCLSPLAILKTLEEFVKKITEYEFLKQDIKDGYHDATQFIHVVRDEYLNIIDREVRESIGLYESKQWEEFIRKYIMHIAALNKNEKIHNPITGKMDPPDQNLIKEFETITEAPKSELEVQNFRKNMISQVGAWSLDHPNEPVIYQKIFPEYWAKIEKHFYESQKAVLTKMHNSLRLFESESIDQSSEGYKLAQKTIKNMTEQLGYSEAGAKEVVSFLMQKRY